MSIDLEPRAVFDIFSEISKIPRGSGNEAAIASHIVAWAKEKGLWSEKDAANNVIIKKPGSPEKENHPSICLQAHLDMVCEKTAESKHDFTKDPIPYKSGTTISVPTEPPLVQITELGSPLLWRSWQTPRQSIRRSKSHLLPVRKLV